MFRNTGSQRRAGMGELANRGILPKAVYIANTQILVAAERMDDDGLASYKVAAPIQCR